MLRNVQNIMDNESPQVCRLCLVEEEGLVYIFDAKGYRGTALWEIIEEFLQLEVSKEDGLPGTICEACVGKVKEFKEFKLTCIRAKNSFLTKMASMGFVSSSSEGPARELRPLISEIDVVKCDSFEPERDSESTGEAHPSKKEVPAGDVGLGGRNYVEMIGTKEKAIASRLLSEKQADSQMNVSKEGYAGMDVSNFASDPLDLIGVKADADEGESFFESETQSPGNFSESQSLGEGFLNVVCLPIEMGDMISVKEEIEEDYSLSHGEIHYQNNFCEDVSTGIAVSNVKYVPLEKEDLTDRKEKVDASVSLPEGETCSQMILVEDDSAGMGVSTFPSDPLDVVGVKEDPDPGKSLSEEDTHSQENLSENQSLDIRISNVECLALEMGDLIGVKEDPDPGESLSEADTHSQENLSENQSLDIGISNVECLPLEMGDLVDDGFIAGKNPKGVNMCDIRGVRNEVTLQRNTHPSRVSQRIKTRKSSTMPPAIKQCDMKKKISAKCKSRFKSGNSNENTFKENYLRLLCSREKISTNFTEYICDNCGMKHTDIKKLLLHIRGHVCNKNVSFVYTSGETSLMCSELKTPRNRGLALYKCEKCGKEFKSKSNLSSHFIAHIRLRQFKCETCGKTFTKKGNLGRHAIIHSDLRPFKCEACGKKFTQKGHLKDHKNIHSGLRPFKCETCGKEFTQKGHLRYHKNIHSGLRPLKCDTCGKSFIEKGSLRKHEIIHRGLRPFKCETCGKEYKFNGSLIKHKTLHNSVKPFKCETCGKEFTQKSHLRGHENIHSGLSSFKCETCGKEFTQKVRLRRHVIIHSGLRPFK